ncbi:MAG: TonB family protein [Acidobacteriota bacterium]
MHRLSLAALLIPTCAVLGLGTALAQGDTQDTDPSVETVIGPTDLLTGEELFPNENLPDGQVVVLDPGDRSFEEGEALAVTPETLVFRRFRQQLERLPDRGGEQYGGPAMLGVNLGNKRQVRRATNLSPNAKAQLEDWDGYGAALLKVHAGSPADAAWLQAGDVIVQVAGLWVDSNDTLIRLISRAELGREFEVWYLRDDQVYRTWVVPRDRSEIPGEDKLVPEGTVLSVDTIGLRLPVLLDSVEPEYPLDALRHHRGGRVLAEVLVDEEGQVANVQLTKRIGRYGFDEAVMEALWQREYEPADLRGQAVSVMLPIRIDFEVPLRHSRKTESDGS